MTAISGETEPQSLPEKRLNHVVRELNGSTISNAVGFDNDDSEAETERLHDSPAKKRPAEDFVAAETKRFKSEEARGPNASVEHKEDKVPFSPKSVGNKYSPVEGQANGKNKASGGEEAEWSSTATPANESEEDESDEENEENEDDEQMSDRETDEERMKAIKMLTDIELEFAKVRDLLHDQQIAKFDLEIMMCSEGSHPELEQYTTQLKEELNTRLQKTRSLFLYQINATFNQSRATRCSVHQTYYKNKFTLRNELLCDVTRRWYQLNYEKREEHIKNGLHLKSDDKPSKLGGRLLKGSKTKPHSEFVKALKAPGIAPVTEAERDSDLHEIGLR